MTLVDEVEKYKILVKKLCERCLEVQSENERCVMRINMVKKLTRRRVKEVVLFKKHLDARYDNWRSLPMVAPHPKRKIELKRGPKPKTKDFKEK